MPITDPEWESIAQLAEKIAGRVSGTKSDYFVTGKVVKADAKNKCIYMAEFGDQAIPLVGFERKITYYDTNASGRVVAKTAVSEIIMPRVGQIVLVARELGTRRLPRALGIIQGTNWITAEDDA
jgi:hypothetical protein